VNVFFDQLVSSTNSRVNIADAIVSASAVTPPLALDGSSQCHALASGTNAVCTLTTLSSPDVIYCTTTQYYQNTVVSISDTAGLTWNTRYSVTAGHIIQKGWYAIASDVLSGDQIKDSETGTSATDDAAMVCLGISGANTASPFDKNVGLPASETQSQGSGVTFSTSNAKDFLIVIGSDGSATHEISANTGWTLIQGISQGAPDYPYDLAAEYQVVSATQSSRTVFFDQFVSSSSSRVNIADAIVGG
jgi:hypothetical protein